MRLTTLTFDILKSDPKLGRAEALRRAMLAYMIDAASPLKSRHYSTGGRVGWHRSPLPGLLFPGAGPWQGMATPSNRSRMKSSRSIQELLSAGGGGRGQAFNRPLERVVEDVRQGYVTIEGARRDYAVVIDPKSLAVDADATAALRRNLQINVRVAAE
jgi:hypothetical protein